MPNSYFQFKQFCISQERSAMKVTTDGCLFGAWIASLLHQMPAQKNLLDVGAGTGLLTLMVAQQHALEITAVEIDADAAAEAMKNVEASPWGNRIDVVHEDIKTFKPGTQYDTIIANPPFYETDLKGPVSARNAAHHSTALMLQELLQVIDNFLAPAGNFLLLLPARRKAEFFSMVKEYSLHLGMCTYVHQTEKHSPFRLMVAGSRTPAETETSKITIKAGDQYTPEFKTLLSPYYLAL